MKHLRLSPPGRASARALVALAVLALVGAVGSATGAAASAKRSTLYVSASGGSDSNPCTRTSPCATIGHAVSVAAPGSTIAVGPGTYAEDVAVTKTLALTGNGATIDASGLDNGIVISGPAAAGSVVSGFTVENATAEGILAVSTTRVTVEHNVVQGNDLGVAAGNTTLPQCALVGGVSDCGEALHFMSVTNSRMLHNTVQNNVGGILVTDESGPASGNLIADNVSRDNHEDCGITLPSHNASALADPSAGGIYGNTVIHNVSDGNGGAGVGMFAPFPGTASYDNRVIGNTLKNNGEAGVAIHAHASQQNVSGNVIVNNTISGNGVDPDSGSGHPTGIALFGAVVPVDVTVAANRIDDEYWGIFTAGTVNASGLPSNKYGSGVTTPVGSGPVPGP